MTTPKIEWSSDFETGIDLIDDQHKRLFDYFTDIQHCIERGDGSQVEPLCRGLIDYVLSHLVFEESLMEQAGYPMFEAHRRVHDAFRRRVDDYWAKRRPAQGGPRHAHRRRPLADQPHQARRQALRRPGEEEPGPRLRFAPAGQAVRLSASGPAPDARRLSRR